MPRVNRDIERRMAERRDRERRRAPTQRRYRFEAPTEGADEPSDPSSGSPQQTRALQASVPRPTVRAAGDNYGLDYRFVLTDLRRVVAVIGILLIVLIGLFFVLPR